jgi:flagellar biosynthesis protein FlhB
MAESELNKSEAATPYKLEQARKKGNVARGMDLGLLAGLSAFTMYLIGNGSNLAEQLKQVIRQAFILAPQLSGGQTELWVAMGLLGHTTLWAMMGLMATIFITVLLLELLQTGWVFAPSGIKPDFTRLNPANGFKRVFSLQMLLETFKGVLKLIAYAWVSYLVIRDAMEKVARANMDARELAWMMAHHGIRLLLFFIGVAAFFAILDQIMMRRFFARKMKMSHRDIKDEHRHREGEPRIKQRRKQLHRELAKRAKSLSGVKGADVLITNPTHYAVGLRYDDQSMAAPKIVAQGAGDFALRLKRMAFIRGVPIIEDKALAQLLFFKGQLDMPVPEVSYASIAPVYLKLRQPPTSDIPL